MIEDVSTVNSEEKRNRKVANDGRESSTLLQVIKTGEERVFEHYHIQ